MQNVLSSPAKILVTAWPPPPHMSSLAVGPASHGGQPAESAAIPGSGDIVQTFWDLFSPFVR